MTMRVEVARDMAGVVLMLARHLFLTGLVAMTLRIQVTRNVTGVSMMLAWNLFLASLVAMTLRVEIARNVAGMVVMLTGLLFCHDAFLQEVTGPDRSEPGRFRRVFDRIG